MSSALEMGPEVLGRGPGVADRQGRRILLLAPQPFYQDRGTPIALRQVLQALSELGYPVDCLTFPVGEDIELPGLEIRRAGNPFEIRSVPIGLSARKLALDFPLTAAFRDQLGRRRYSCIHAVEEAAFPAVLLGGRRGIPVLYDMQSSLAEQLLQHALFRFAPVRRVIEGLERRLLERADLVVGSAGLAERVRRVAPGTTVREWRFPSHPIASDPAAAAELRLRLGFAPEHAIVVYSGSFEPYQGLPALIAAIPRVLEHAPDARFVLVGADRANGFAGGEAVGALLRSGALKLIDRQPRDMMSAYHSMADILVSPRAYGGNLPLKVFDYLAAGRPIVATDIPTHRTVLAEDRAVLVAPESAALAEGILALLGDPVRAARLAAAARRYAGDHLGWDAFVAAVEEIYEEAHRNAPAR